jgi:hypothetical protein
VQNLGERRRSGNVREGAKIISSNDPAFFALPPAQFVNAMPTCHLTHPRAKGIFLILFLEDNVKFQEDFRRGISLSTCRPLRPRGVHRLLLLSSSPTALAFVIT